MAIAMAVVLGQAPEVLTSLSQLHEQQESTSDECKVTNVKARVDGGVEAVHHHVIAIEDSCGTFSVRVISRTEHLSVGIQRNHPTQKTFMTRPMSW